MVDSAPSSYTRQELDRLQRLRASVLAFKKMIAPLPANEQNNAHNEQFNQLLTEAKALLKERNFDKKVSKAITEDMLAVRAQRVILPRLSGIVIFGVILALLGLGVNSIILEDLIINSLGCLVSSVGMLLIWGALGIWVMSNYRRRLTNLGELYLQCDPLLYQINNTLSKVIPGWVEHSPEDLPEIPSVVELALDSLQKQASDWQQKLNMLEEQRRKVGLGASLELEINIDFVRRELNHVTQEMRRLEGRSQADFVPVVEETSDLESIAAVDTESPPDFEERPVTETQIKEIASSPTMGMPISNIKEASVAEMEQPTSSDLLRGEVVEGEAPLESIEPPGSETEEISTPEIRSARLRAKGIKIFGSGDMSNVRTEKLFSSLWDEEPTEANVEEPASAVGDHSSEAETEETVTPETRSTKPRAKGIKVFGSGEMSNVRTEKLFSSLWDEEPTEANVEEPASAIGDHSSEAETEETATPETEKTGSDEQQQIGTVKAEKIVNAERSELVPLPPFKKKEEFKEKRSSSDAKEMIAPASEEKTTSATEEGEINSNDKF